MSRECGYTVEWLPLQGAEREATDISFAWIRGCTTQLVVTVHYLPGAKGSPDLRLEFQSPLAVVWEDECLGVFTRGIHHSPADGGGRYLAATAIVRDSDWAKENSSAKYAADDPDAKKVTHYYIAALNDYLHVLAEEEPIATWTAVE